MNTIGIISEYNPFHKGHAYQLEQLNTMHPDSIRIAIMSGSFVQRGEPAYFSKFDRSRWAILSGVDVVIELPIIYSLGSAEIVSTGAIRLSNTLHIDAISVGTEVDDVPLLKQASDLMNSVECQMLIRKELQKGASYGSALRQVLSSVIPNGFTLSNSPNAILALEYLRSASRHYPEIQWIPIHRASNHHDALLQTAALPSGTALRHALQQGQRISEYVPRAIAADINEIISQGKYTDYERYENLLLGIHRLLSIQDLSTLADFTEGIEHRWHTMTAEPSWSDVKENIKTKRYTYARIQRMAAYGALHITKELQRHAHIEGPQYARLLAFNNRGRQWLKTATLSIPLIQKWAKAPSIVSSLGKDLLRLDELATDLQAYTFKSESYRTGRIDYTYSPQYINI